MRVHAQPQEAPAKVGKAKAVPGKEQEAKEIHGSTSRMAPPGHEGNNPGPEAEVHSKVGSQNSRQGGLESHTKVGGLGCPRGALTLWSPGCQSICTALASHASKPVF